MPPVALALALILTLVASAPEGHRFAPLFDLGRALAVVGLAVAILHRLVAHRALTLAAPWALALTVFGLGSILARHPWDFRVFSDVHPADFGLPSELAFVALALGLRRAAHHRDPLAHGLVALGVAWGLVALLVPEPTLGATVTALGSAFADPMRALFALALLAALALGLVHLVGALTGAAPTRITPLARHLPHTLLALVALSGLASPTPLAALTVAALALAIGLLAEAVLRDRDAAPTPANDRLLPIAALAVIVALWLLLKSQALIASNTDENIYFYMARLVADGKLPYQDFFFAHPPLHIVLPGAFFAVFGFSLELAKLFSVGATLVAGLAVWALARRALAPSWQLAAPLALVLYLFGAEVLKASSNMTGVNLTVMWLMLGAWQTFSGHPRRAGLFLGLAVTTGFYAIAPALALTLIAFFWRPDPSHAPAARARSPLSNGLAQLATFALVAGLINLVFWSIGGDTYLEGVYAYHQEKRFEHPDMVEIFGATPGFPLSILHNLGVMIGTADFHKEVFYHAHLWLAGLALPLVVLASWLAARTERGPLYRALLPTTLFTSGPDGRALALWLVTLALFIELAMFRELYSFYFALIYPFLALGLAYVIARALALLTPSPAVPAPTDSAPSGKRPLVAAVLALVALLGVAHHGVVGHHTQIVFDDELEVLGARNTYQWTDPPALTALAGLTKLLFWEDHRHKGDLEPGYRHYLWTKKRGFTVLAQVAAHIRQGSAPDESIAGSSTLAPLVALLAERRIAADEVDTNNKRFQTGLLDEKDYWDAICADKVRFIVSAPRSYFTPQKVESLPVIARAFTRDARFEDPTLQYSAPFPITLYRRIDGAECRW